jgi:hypothetical protein
MVGPEPTQPGVPLFSNIRIRPPPVDDVNNLRHDGKSQRCLRFGGDSDPPERSIHITGIRTGALSRETVLVYQVLEDAHGAASF